MGVGGGCHVKAGTQGQFVSGWQSQVRKRSRQCWLTCSPHLRARAGIPRVQARALPAFQQPTCQLAQELPPETVWVALVFKNQVNTQAKTALS